jgi:GMP synthase-like glutamine amidotransferase
MPKAVCLQHVPFEGPGAFAASLSNRGVNLERYLVPKDGLPKDAGDLLIVMGGPMSVNDPDPWIAEETAFIRSALLSGKAVIGVCLGSQFMAKALGGSVHPGKALEIGKTRVHLTEHGRQDPVFGVFPEALSVFEWHGEVFDLPNDCVPLAGSEIAPLQAFRFGSRAYGLLFHLEIETEGVDALCRECGPDLDRAGLTASNVSISFFPHMWLSHQMADQLVGHLLRSSR